MEEILINVIGLVLVFFAALALVIVFGGTEALIDRWIEKGDSHTQRLRMMSDWFLAQIWETEDPNTKGTRVRGYCTFLATLRGADHRRGLQRFIEESVKCEAMFPVLADGDIANDKEAVVAAVAARSFLADQIRHSTSPDKQDRARKLVLLSLKKRTLRFLNTDINAYEHSLIQTVVNDEIKKEAKRNRVRIAAQT